LQAYSKVRVLWAFGGTWAVNVGGGISRGRTHTLFQAEKVVSLLPGGNIADFCPSDPDNYCEDPTAACTGDGQCVKFAFTPAANGGVEGRPIVTGLCLQRSGQPAAKYVRLVYLVPKDRTEKEVYKRMIDRGAKFVRRWFRDQLVGLTHDDKMSFVLHPDGVKVVKTDHDAAWYGTHGTAAEYRWWNNVRDDAFRLAGGKYNDPDTVWIYFIDSDSPCGERGGAGGNGIAILPANDLRGLSGETLRECPNSPENPSVCRWVGGLAHEMGHAFGLPHPPGCDQGTSQCTDVARGSLMWLGYLDIGETYLLHQDWTDLRQSSFFSKATDTAPNGSCHFP
jgi:hypothetical protein